MTNQLIVSWPDRSSPKLIISDLESCYGYQTNHEARLSSLPVKMTHFDDVMSKLWRHRWIFSLAFVLKWLLFAANALFLDAFRTQIYYGHKLPTYDVTSGPIATSGLAYVIKSFPSGVSIDRKWRKKLEICLWNILEFKKNRETMYLQQNGEKISPIRFTDLENERFQNLVISKIAWVGTASSCDT